MAKKAAFKGSITALVTPFRDGRLDEDRFRALVDWQIAGGTHGLVPAGTTGESPTLSHEEHRQVIAACIAEAKGRVPVIAGTGSNNTHEAIELSRFAERARADGLLVVTPYYKKPSTAISKPSTMRSAFPSLSTTSPRARLWTCRLTR